MIPSIWLVEASTRLAPYIHRTALTYDSELDLFLKWENQQITGSFKLRGALNKVLTLQPWEREQGLVTASAGNHGQGLAVAGSRAGAPVVVFASEQAVPAKISAMRKLGAEVRLVPGGYGQAEAAGLAYASEHGATWVSPYNDGQVVAGQATLGLEIIDQLTGEARAAERPTTWVVPVGGGGLAAGIASAVFTSKESRRPGSRLVGVQPENSPFFHAIFHRGSQEGQVELPTLADGLAGPVEENSLTIPILRHYLDDFVLVSEEEIGQAVVFAWKRYGEIIEGSAAAALAAVLSGRITARPAVVVLSGGNIQPEIHANLCAAKKGFLG